jgi:peptidoglycan/LPS O-acetylase OafA/YrhL
MSTPSTLPPTAARATPDGRLSSLDGLRGLAALIVVFHHLSLTYGPIADVFYVSQYPPTASPAWWLTLSPAQLLVAGPEAVLVFFVLSGVVLTLPVLRRAGSFDWAAYYPQRVVRLYLPAIASVAFAAILVLATSWSSAPSTSKWVAASRFSGFEPARILSDWDLLFGNATLNNPLWTLRWEVLFSLVLPVIVILTVALARWWPLVLIGCLALVYVGVASGLQTFRYLPVFVIGALIAVHHQRLSAWAVDAQNLRRVRWGGLIALVLSLVALNLHWSALGLAGGVPYGQAYLIALEPLGAAGLVVLAAYWPPARSLLQTPFFHWLGRISFSVYLVHVPIIDALDVLFGFWATPVRVVLSLVLALGIGELFSRFVEQPSHRLAKRVGAAAASLLRRAGAPREA